MSLWGHKVTVHIYVPGDIGTAADVSNDVIDALPFDGDSRVVFVGVGIDNVQHEPIDMAGT